MRSQTKSPKRKRAAATAPAIDEAVVPVPAASTVDTPAAPTIALASNCTVKDAAALKNSLCAIANEDGCVVLDAGRVERVDTATIQLLCAFVCERVGRNQSVVWQNASSALLEAARLLGVQKLLALPPADSVGAAA